MPEGIRIGIIGGGWPGTAHAKGYQDAGGFKLLAIADLIPERRKKMMADFGITREYASAEEMIADVNIDAVSLCLPTHLHAPIALAALRAGKHVVCETPPAMGSAEAKRMDSAAAKKQRVLLYGFQRRFGGHEQASRQAIEKGYIGDVYHARATWTRTRGIPQGTGWFTQKEKSGGGCLIDIGVHMLDLAWNLLGQPIMKSVSGVTHRRFTDLVSGGMSDVEDAAFALIRFEGGKSLELAATWAFNQPPQQNGLTCRVHGDKGAIDVYTPRGAMLYRNFDAAGECKDHELKPPKLTGHASMMRHFKACIDGKATATPGGKEGVELMRMVEGVYRSAE